MSLIKVGIDPDAHRSGVALVSGTTILELHSLKLPSLVRYLKDCADKDKLEVILEDLEQWKSIKPRQGQSVKAMLKIARNVGKCQGTAKAIYDLLTDAGIEVRQAKPLRGPVKRQAKNNGRYFNRLTGWTGRSNQDTRDAALLALYG